MQVSKAQAEQVLEAIKAKWPEAEGWSHVDGPTLYPHDHEELPEGAWSIAWEGAPEDWTMKVSEDIKVSGVLLEPMNSWSLALYPREETKQLWLEVSGADQDFKTARRANEAWLAGAIFKDNTTGQHITINDIGPTLNVAIRYNDGAKVTAAEHRSTINPNLAESEAKAIIEGLSEQQAKVWVTKHKNSQMFIALEWPDSPRPPMQDPETD